VGGGWFGPLGRLGAVTPGHTGPQWLQLLLLLLGPRGERRRMRRVRIDCPIVSTRG